MQIKWNMETHTRDLEAVACVMVEFNFSDLSKFIQRYIATVDTWNDSNHTTILIGDISEGELVREMVLELGDFPTLTEGMVAAHKVIERHNADNIENALRAFRLCEEFEMKGDLF